MVLRAGAGSNDQVALQGNYTGANALVLEAGTLTNVEVLAALAGGNYDITSDDDAVVAGQVFTVFAGGLDSGDSLTFNGSAETDGSFLFFGGQGTDTLTGGANSDTFVFNAAADSASTGFDTILDFDRASDTIQVNGQTYASFTDLSGGQLSQASFDTDLSSQLGTTLTGTNGVFFTASSGDYAGQTFLVVNIDGVDGYQQGSDLVIRTDPGAPVTVEAFGGGSAAMIAPLDTAAPLDHHPLIIA